MISIPVTLTTRQWMKAAKAYRFFFDLPTDSIVAAQLTALIERKVNASIQANGWDKIEMQPAFIVDVPNKGKKFSLILETVTPQQTEIGARLTPLIGEQMFVKLTPENTLPVFDEAEPQTEGTISSQVLKGLHSTWFKNRKFWMFLGDKTGQNINSEQECKSIFKDYMGIESCRHLLASKFKPMRDQFTEYVNRR